MQGFLVFKAKKSGLMAQEGIAIQMGGVLPYRLEVYLIQSLNVHLQTVPSVDDSLCVEAYRRNDTNLVISLKLQKGALEKGYWHKIGSKLIFRICNKFVTIMRTFV